MSSKGKKDIEKCPLRAKKDTEKCPLRAKKI